MHSISARGSKVSVCSPTFWLLSYLFIIVRLFSSDEAKIRPKPGQEMSKFSPNYLIKVRNIEFFICLVHILGSSNAAGFSAWLFVA